MEKIKIETGSVSPVALFAFRRPAHLLKTLEALARNPEASRTAVFAFVDAPQVESDAALVDRVCLILGEFAVSTAFKSLEVHRAKEAKGLARSVIEGVSLVLQDHDRVIGLEDDIVLAPTGLGFLNGALDAYQFNRDVWSVSAFTPPLKMPGGFNDSTFFSRRASSWGYATWKDRWDEIFWDDEYFRKLALDPRFRRRFALGGNDLPLMLDEQLEGSIDSWAVRWCARQAELGSFTVYPSESLVCNIGLDGSGTHSPLAEVDPGGLGKWCNSGDGFGIPKLNAQMSRRFRNYYVSRTRLIVSKVRRRVRVVVRSRATRLF